MNSIVVGEEMTLEAIRATLRVKRNKIHNALPSYYGEIGFVAGKQVLIIRFPDSRVVKFIARSMLLALMIMLLPLLGANLRKINLNFRQAYMEANTDAYASNASTNVNFLPIIFRDLANEGLMKTGEKAIFVTNGNDQESHIPGNENEMEMISASDSDHQNSISDESIDFIFGQGGDFIGKEFVDRTLKIGGIVALKVATHEPSVMEKPSNYKILYLRKFDEHTVIAMRKTSNHVANGIDNATTKRRLLGFAPEAKKAALEKLEDVLLEPPRASSGKSSRYLKRTKYLPDLLGDTLEDYPRRVFIDVGLPEKKGGTGTGWFAKHYPTRNLHFDTYKIETAAAEPSQEEAVNMAMSDWLSKNVKEEEYVVMKAEAEVVDEMMVNSKAMKLVDELFLECKPGKGKRAYWECLALYGKLRDEGVAVHQWWG